MTHRSPDQDKANDSPAKASKGSVITPLALDAARYAAHLDGFDLSEAQQLELLETLWNILRTMVDIGFGLDSVHLFLPPAAEIARDKSADALKARQTTQRFHQAAMQDPEEDDKEQDDERRK